MKKLKLSLLLILGAFGGLQAQIPNGGFENWTTATHDWLLTNYRQDGGQKYQPAQSGSYAIKLTTSADPTDLEDGLNTSEVASGLSANPLKGGFPYVQQPTKFIFYAKYDIKAGDAASIALIFKKNGAVISGAYTNNIFKITGTSTSSYQKFEFPITGLSNVPDSVIIIACSYDVTNNAGGTGGATAQAGSYIIIDNMSFDTSNPIPFGDFEEWGRSAVEYPNNYMMWGAYEVVVDCNVTNPLQKTTDAHNGSYAMKATTYVNPYESNNNGVIGGGVTGDIFKNKDTKFSCTQKTGTFRAWYKYIPASTDTAFIAMTFYKNGVNVGYVGKDLYAKSSYSGISVPFFCSETPDSAIIQFASSKMNLTKNIGSTLYLDDISLEADVEWHNYDANVTPDNDGWSKTAVNTSTDPIANPSASSIIAINASNNYLSCVSDSTHANGYEYGSELMSSSPLTVMFRAKSGIPSSPKLGGYFEVDLGPSYLNTILKFKWNTTATTPYRYVGLSNVTSATGKGNTNIDWSVWHIYRMTFDGDSVRVYIDENMQASLSGKVKAPTTTKTSTYALKIVGSSISNFASGDIDWISWNYKGAFAPGQGTLPSSYITSDVETVKGNNNTIGIYPNPASNSIRLSGNIQNAIISIADINSRTVLTQALTEGEDLNISSLPQGIYIVKIETENGTSQTKLIKK